LSQDGEKEGGRSEGGRKEVKLGRDGKVAEKTLEEPGEDIPRITVFNSQ